MDLLQVKQRFGIIGKAPALDRAMDVALRVAPTDLSVLISGESGAGKENFPQIIHQFSMRKHGTYIPVNCGAIPEGTIDSELFGHEKGAFTGAHDHRKGYFEVADKGTIFLDEVAELPLATQVRLLRVLESGEFIKVGSSKVQKTDVRVIAATNINLPDAIKNGKFREDLYYRLNTVPIFVPPLRQRKEDVLLLFRKFAQDFAEKYRMPPLQLSPEAGEILVNYRWRGNVRQLKNVTEQMSIIEKDRMLSGEVVKNYLPDYDSIGVPALYNQEKQNKHDNFANERELLYKFLFDMKKDMNDLKKLVRDVIHKGPENVDYANHHPEAMEKLYSDPTSAYYEQKRSQPLPQRPDPDTMNIQDTEEYVEESLSLHDKEIEMINKALEKHNGKRKMAAKELGISERTLYRKIKEYKIE